MATVHWLEDPQRKRLSGHEHINKIRMSAETVLKLVRLRNKLSGKKNTVYEASVASETQES